MTPRCKTCVHFWHDRFEDCFGECRFRAPVLAEDGTAGFPPMSTFDSCGDYTIEITGEEVGDEEVIF